MSRRRALPRSYLFVPASRPERIPKALATGADAVIVDLEDAVAPVDKDAARAALVAALDPARPVIVRVNGPGTGWFEPDLAVCSHVGVSAVMLPKAECADDVARVHQHCGRPVLALVETARGVWNALEIARAPGVERLAFGALDFRLDLGLADAGYEQLRTYRDRLVLASRVADIAPPIDAPTPALDDAALVRAEAWAAREAGFGGKLCIHPNQVPVVNECFRPSPQEIAWAKKVRDAARTAQGAAFAVDGRMVDRPVVDLAERILDEAADD